MKLTTRILALLASMAAGTMPAIGADLTMGYALEPPAIDPLFSRTTNSMNVAGQIFDSLTSQDSKLALKPGLALSWTNLDETTWRIVLRPDVLFHDGSKFTADDVVFSFTKALNTPKSPAPFTGNVANIASMNIIDPLTIEFKTKSPAPLFMEDVGNVYIVSKTAAEGKSIEDFNNGTATIGTGPFKFKEWRQGDRLTLVRNDAYWGSKPEFENVTIRFIANDAARVAALRSGAVDLIDAVPPEEAASIAKMDGMKVFSIVSARFVYVALDTSRDISPLIVDANGKPLDPNPLKDRRVRLAMAKMVNSKLIVDRILGGSAEVASQVVPEGSIGYASALKPIAYDPDGAKKLLAEAGYPDGFTITLNSSNDRFPGDKDVAQAVGQMFARGGLKVAGIVAQPYNVFLPAATKQEFSAYIISRGTYTPSSASSIINMLMTQNKELGIGAFNRTRYSNPAFDTAMNTVMKEFDNGKRQTLLEDATKLVFDDVPVVPLYMQKVHWAGKAKLNYEANMSELTSAKFTSLAK